VEADRLKQFNDMIIDAWQHIYRASQDFIFCQRERCGGSLTAEEEELIVSAWISALAAVRQQIVKTAEARGYEVEPFSFQQIEKETKMLESWLSNVKERQSGE